MVVVVICGCGPAAATTGVGSGDTTGTSGDATGTSGDATGTSGDGSDASAEGSSTGDDTEACTAVATESVHCLTVSGSTVHLVGMDTGRTCERFTFDAPVSSVSLAWEGDELVGCGDTVWRADLTTGEVTQSDAPCHALTRHPDGILVMPSPSDGVQLFSSFDAIRDGVAIEAFAVEPYAERIAFAGDVLYGAWHSTDRLERWDLESRTQLDDLVLGGYDGWVWGLSVVGERVFVLGRDALGEFEAGSGALVQTWPVPDSSAQGLACR